MSAYIVEKATIDRIASHLYGQPTYHWTEAERQHIPSDPTEIGQRLYALNVAAVDARYNETNPIPLYRFESRPSRSIQLLKSLRCLLYQCSEGDVPKRPLYQLLEDESHRLALDIISSLPEWTAADWA